MDWIEPLAYIAASVVVLVIECLVKRFTGYWLPPRIKAAIFQVINILVAGQLKKKVSGEGDCFRKSSSGGFPAPPKTLALITGAQLKELLKPYGINLRCPSDWTYGLPSKSDLLRFFRWYKTHAPIKPSDYTEDDLDCDDFAWIMRADFLIWCRGKCVGGYIEAAGIDEYTFPMHGFMFTVDWSNNVYFADHLEVAASVDGLDPAYEVRSQDVKA